MTDSHQSLLTLPGWHEPVTTLGDRAILEWQPQCGFFCSQRYPAKAVLPSFDWAKRANAQRICVISGFHSLLEKDVFEILLRGEQPMVWVTARTLPKRLSPSLRKEVDASRLLIISPIQQTRPTAKSADIRNRFIIAIAPTIVVAHAHPEGKLHQALGAAKSVQYLVT